MPCRTNKSLPKKITDTLQQAAPSVTGGIGVSLTELDLSGCRSITSPGVISLACSLRGLRVLRLRDCDKVCGVALASCCDHLTELRELDLRGLNDLTDTSLSSISCLVRLEWLGVGSKQAMGPWLSSLKHLPELRQLSLRGCNELTDIGFTSHFPGRLPMIGLPGGVQSPESAAFNVTYMWCALQCIRTALAGSESLRAWT